MTEVIDYGTLAADRDPKVLKAAVDLAAVVQHYGIALESDGNSRLAGHCPFHEDDRPSFGVWKWPDGSWACGCWACDFGNSNDLFDFLQRFHDCNFITSLARARELRDSNLPPAPEIVNQEDTRPPNFGRALDRATSIAAVSDLLFARGIDVPVEWVREHFQVRSDEGTIFVPHYDKTDQLIGVKRRSESFGWTPIAMRGSQLHSLYGIWRAKGRREIVLCEGESDTWTVAYLLREQPVDVLGLPSGVNTHIREEWEEDVRGKDVTILFDADRAGRDGAGKWAAKISGVARSVRVACLSDGLDATSAGFVATQRALDEAWSFVNPSTLPVMAQGGRYVRIPKDEDKPAIILSDFVLTPERLVMMDGGGIVFEVSVPNHQSAQIITGADLASVDKMRRWATDRLLSWKGSARDLADLLEVLKAASILVPRVRGTDVVGLHENAFVLPDDVIGSVSWGYVPPENDVNLGAALRLSKSTEWDRMLPLAMTALHKAEIITPIVGWVAAAPLRSHVSKFPVLGVTGGSGWGKTTLIETVLKAFGFWDIAPTTLTGATPHGVLSYAGSTNAFPIWFDEYRPGARMDAKLALDQVIRDAWDGAATIKGGMSENRMKIKHLPARAPLIVTGEDSFSETSHAERMVMIEVEPDGRDVHALQVVRDMKQVGFGRAYLEWLLHSLHEGTLPAEPALLDRPEQARAVAAWGYQLLDQFCREVLGYELPPFDISSAVRAYQEIKDVPVIVQAIHAAMDAQDRDGKFIVWRDEDDVCVRPIQLTTWVERETDLQLPGRSMAVRNWLKKQYKATEFRHPVFGQALRVPGIAGS